MPTNVRTPMEYYEEAASRLRYVPQTGHLIWTHHYHSTRIGTRAGSTDNRGYWRVGITLPSGRFRSIQQHRLIMFILEAEIPDQVDHINGNTLDNREVNLRSCTASENQHNRKTNRNNSSGCSGVYWNKGSKKWRSFIYVEGKNVHLGFFFELDDAVAARDAGRLLHHGDAQRPLA